MEAEVRRTNGQTTSVIKRTIQGRTASNGMKRESSWIRGCDQIWRKLKGDMYRRVVDKETKNLISDYASVAVDEKCKNKGRTQCDVSNIPRVKWKYRCCIRGRVLGVEANERWWKIYQSCIVQCLVELIHSCDLWTPRNVSWRCQRCVLRRIGHVARREKSVM